MHDHDLDRPAGRPRLAGLGRLATPLLSAAFVALPLAAQEYEWEADEGIHEEEWYDPSDWFDDDPYDDAVGVDYEIDWDAYSAYWDGYYDGYYDDVYGYDYWDNDWGPAYASSYTDGYYDGYYDSTQDYDFDPSYYVFTWYDPYDNRADDQKRSKDETRDRGDRANAASDEASKADRTESTQEVQRMRRHRGTVESMKAMDTSKSDDHLVLRMKFEDDSSLVADLGPKVERDDLMFSSGDRVTIAGKRKMRGDREVMVVHEIVHEGESMRLRGSYADMTRDRGMNRKNRDDGRKRGSGSGESDADE